MKKLIKEFSNALNLFVKCQGNDRKNEISDRYKTQTDLEILGEDFRKIIDWGEKDV